MLMRILVQGNDGSHHYNPGDECASMSDWAIRMLVNDLADPLDDEAKAIVKRQKELNEQFGNPALKKEAAEARKKFAEQEAAKKAAEAKK